MPASLLPSRLLHKALRRGEQFVSLVKPSRTFAKQSLTVISVDVARLYRISRHSSGEPFFGRAAANRFDDPTSPKSKRFGTCYCGFDMETALAETVLHDEMPANGAFSIDFTSFSTRHLVRFKGERLNVANMTGIPLKTLAGSGELSTIVPYDIPQAWSKALHSHPAQVDGIYYMSRHLNDRPAVVIFDRAAHKITNTTYTPILKAKGMMEAVTNLRISFDYA